MMRHVVLDANPILKSTRYRMIITTVGHSISLVLLLSAASALAQPSVGPTSQSAVGQVESVIVNGASSQAINHFVQAVATPTHTIGKVARWEVPICPYAMGLPDNVTALVVQRLKAVAAQVGVRVSNETDCKPNILIVFTSAPQALLDNIRTAHPIFLGYHVGPEDLDRLAIVNRPIQAWYSTATQDLRGRTEIDSPQTDSADRGLVINLPCYLTSDQFKIMTPSGPAAPANAMCTRRLPYATAANVEGSRLDDGLRATFNHAMIVANTSALRESRATIDDYIAMLALTEIKSLDTCQHLFSITNLLVSGCQLIAQELTANDVGYLKAVYQANPAMAPGLQQNEIALRMEQNVSNSGDAI